MAHVNIQTILESRHADGLFTVISEKPRAKLKSDALCSLCSEHFLRHSACLERSKRPMNALQLALRAAAINEENTRAFYRIGTLLETNNEFELARDAYAHAMYCVDKNKFIELTENQQSTDNTSRAFNDYRAKWQQRILDYH